MTFKTTLETVKNTVKDISNISASAYVGSDGLFDSATVLAYKTQLQGLTRAQAEASLTSAGLTKEQRNQVLSALEATTATKALTAGQIEERIATQLNSAEDAKVITQKLVKAGLLSTESGATNVLTMDILEQAVANGTLTASEMSSIASALGLAGANGILSTSFNILTASIWANIKALVVWLATNPVGWIILTVGAFAGLAKITDLVTVSVEEQRKKLENLKNEYSEIKSELKSLNDELTTTKQRMLELEGKDNLTFAEKEEYDNLVKINNELQRKIDLLELEEKNKRKERNKAFVKTMTKDTEDPFEYEVNPDGKNAGQYGIDDNYLTSETGYIEYQFEEREKLLEKLSKAETEKEKKAIQKKIDKIDKFLQDKSNQWASDMDGIEYIENPTTEDEKAVNEWLDFINDYQDRMAIAMGGDNAKTNTFNRLVDNWYFDDTVQDLQNLGTQGKVTAEMLNDPKYDEFINKLLLLGVIDSADNLEDIALAFNSIAKSADNANDALSNLPDEPLSITDSIKQIADQLEPQFAKLGEAYRDIFTEDGFTLDNIDNSMLEDLRDTFTDIEEELGVTFDITQLDNFFEVLTNGSSTAADVQNAFNRLASSYLNSTDVLESLNEETAESVIKQLEQMGVTNAETLVNDALTLKLKWVEKAKENNIETTNELQDATYEEINALKDENGKLDETEQKLYNFWMQKNAVNDITIVTNGDIQNLVSLMETADSACENLKKLARVKARLATLDEMYANGEISARTYQRAVDTNTKLLNGEDIVDDNTGQTSNIKDILSGAQKEVDDYYTNFGINVNYDGNKASDADDKDKKDKDPKQFDWIERAIAKTEKELDELDSKVANTYSNWVDRNKALVDSISSTKDAIALQRNAYNAYMNEANKLGLDPTYVNLIQNGALDVSKISDEKLADKISEYQSLYDSAQDCLKTANELENTLNELQYNEKWELFSTEIDASINEFEEYINTWQSKIDKAELQGRFTKSSYYENMRALTENQLGDLTTKANTLQKILSNMTPGKEAYDTLFAEFLSIEGEISELENNIIEFNNNIRDLNWEIFDYLEDSISRITDETQYLIDLLANEDLFDKDTGKFTKYSDATLGLHAVNYDTYKQQAQDYYEEVQELQRQLVNGAGQEVLEQYNKMVDAHQDAVLAAEDEKQAMLDLIEEGYNAQLEAIQKIIDKKKEQMNQEKDLYDYQKSIAEKTKNIASLEKQKLAYEGDDSEEGMSRIQQIKVELEEAKADLEQTEYEKYLDDSQRMLDELTQDYEDWMNERLDDEDALLKEIVSGISNKGDEINNTLQTVANENGTFISDTITSIFDANSPFTSELSSIKTNTAGTTNAINDLINKIVGITGAQTKGNAGGTSGSNGNSNGSSNAGGGSNKTPSTPTTPNNTNANKNASNNSSKGEYDGIFIYKKYSPQQLNTNTSLVDRLKSKNIDASWEARAKYWSKIFGGAYTGSESQNIKFLNWLKSNGYKSGTSSAKKGLHWTQENGEEFIIRKSDGAILTPLGNGDMVFDNEASRRLWELSQNPEKYLANMAMPQLSVGMPNYSGLAAKGNVSQTMEVRIDGISIELPGITNYEEFRSKFIKDGVVMDAIFTSVNNNVMNKNPLAHLQYSRRR